MLMVATPLGPVACHLLVDVIRSYDQLAKMRLVDRIDSPLHPRLLLPLLSSWISSSLSLWYGWICSLAIVIAPTFVRQIIAP